MQTNKLNLKIKQLLGDNIKKILIKLLIPQRNSFLLFNYTNKAKKNRVNLNYWLESPNLGDALSPIIVNYMLSLKGISQDIEIPERRHLYAVGSVLTAGIQDCTVWGSGVLNASLSYRLEKRILDVRAVRGPFTRAVLMDYGYDVPEIYGDPAILMPEIYSPHDTIKKARYGLIIHKDDDMKKTYTSTAVSNDVIVIDICTADYRDFIIKINSVDIVISSSLHGIILSEAYGIKAILLQPKCDILKYYDWYFSTNRIKFPIAKSLQEAKSLTPAELPKLDVLRADLKKAFPYDIYK